MSCFFLAFSENPAYNNIDASGTENFDRRRVLNLEAVGQRIELGLTHGTIGGGLIKGLASRHVLFDIKIPTSILCLRYFQKSVQVGG